MARRLVGSMVLFGAVHELMNDGSTLDEAKEVVASWPEEMLIREVYVYLHEQCSPAILVCCVHARAHPCVLSPAER